MTELGNRLKEARLAKKMSLDDLQTATKIQKRYLIGIEEGNYSSMPGKFYVRAFIKQYAEAVGIEPEEIFEQYKNDIPNSSVNEDIPEKLSRVQSRKNIPAGNSKIFDILPKILLAVFVIGALAVLYNFLQKANDGENANEQTNNSDSETVRIEESEDFAKDSKTEIDEEPIEEETPPEEETVEEVIPKQEISVAETSGRNTVYELKNADQFELKVVSTGETWVDIKNGKGTSFFTGTLKKDDNGSQTIDFSKETEAVLVIGNSTQTEVYINDEKIEFAIAPNQSVRQDITIRYLPSNE